MMNVAKQLRARQTVVITITLSIFVKKSVLGRASPTTASVRAAAGQNSRDAMHGWFGRRTERTIEHRKRGEEVSRKKIVSVHDSIFHFRVHVERGEAQCCEKPQRQQSLPAQSSPCMSGNIIVENNSEGAILRTRSKTTSCGKRALRR